MSRRSLCRGMTLVEVAVYCVLLSLFSVVLFGSLPGASNASLEKLQDATVTANLDLTKLTMELSNSAAPSVTIFSKPPGIAFLAAVQEADQPFTYTLTGEIAWIGWVGYLWDGSTLTRYWYPLKAPSLLASVGKVPTPDTLITGGTSKALRGRVSQFSVSLKEAGLWQVELQTEVDGHFATLTSGVGARN